MAVPATSGTGSVNNVSGSASSGGALSTKAFKNDVNLKKIAGGTAPAISRVRGAPKSEAVKTVQLAMFSLGIFKKREDIRGVYGPATEASIKAFQASKGLEQIGKIDSNFVRALDKASMEAIQVSKAKSLPEGSKRTKYQLLADISDPTGTRLYVLNEDGDIQARYLISPGTEDFPTLGDKFRIVAVLPRQPWNPPASSWAKNAKPIAAGLDNPMGILKLSFGAYAEYLHGVPWYEEADLGEAASHGCVRMSGSNILEVAEKWAEAGTEVVINRDMAKSGRLRQQFEDSGMQDRPTDAGREHLFGYVSGELGKYQKFAPPLRS